MQNFKIRSLPFIICILCFFELNGQTVYNPIDSLTQVVNELKKNSSKKIPILFKLLEYQKLAGDFSAMELSLSKIKNSKKFTRNAQYQYKYQQWQAKVHLEKNEYTQAVKILKELPPASAEKLQFENQLLLAKAFYRQKKVTQVIFILKRQNK